MLIDTLSGVTTKTTTASNLSNKHPIPKETNAMKLETSNEVCAGVFTLLVFSLCRREVEGENDFAHWINTRRRRVLDKAIHQP